MYDLTYIISPLAGELDNSVVSGKIDALINSLGGIIKKETAGEKRKLAYPIKKQSVGFYVTLEMELEPEKLIELEKTLRMDKDILRYLIINLAELKTERAPRRTFIKAKSPVLGQTGGEAPTKTEKVKIEELDRKLEEILKE
jgi:small subunit ribosomal protein S6